ncbi:CRISPR/Cas system-associated protein Csm6 [Rhodopseudomonas rhenobacensis]|uniref:CRISPR/Cas system-associated protein Csm6 n=1 Tax=Rhodopseudomonas rhenobacensis TaxID=87461 RepID=A0A7W7Z6U2_9BRAD|nr:hypothetical protein [Rhodopseudomonas rhenobacensis]MBB5048928.1 CRISPR/Cas system-associated protein Csm6 [Rhodopseudomonas rhenobacensis]
MIHRSAIAFALLLTGAGLIGPAFAAPPTVTPSPGYDQRLIESRRELGARVLVAPPEPVLRRHRRAVRHRR